MKTISIIGGIGPESTIVHYRSILATYREQSSDGSAPSILINSLDLTKMLALISKAQLTQSPITIGRGLESWRADDQTVGLPCIMALQVLKKFKRISCI